MSKYAEYTTEQKLIDIIIEDFPKTKDVSEGFGVTKYYCEFVYKDFKVSGFFYPGTIRHELKNLNKYHFDLNSEFLFSTGGCMPPSANYAPLGKDLFTQSKRIDKVEKVSDNQVLLYIGKDKIQISLENKYIEYLKEFVGSYFPGRSEM